MAKYAVYIPTRRRPAFAAAAAISAQRAAGGLPVYVAAEAADEPALRVALAGTGVLPLRIDGDGLGLGFSRWSIIQHADSMGYKSALMIDDDIAVSGDVPGWLKFASRPDVVGATCWRSQYSLWHAGSELGRAKANGGGAYLHSGQAGAQVFAVNVSHARNITRLPQLRMLEDSEIMRYGYFNVGVPWYSYTDATAGNVVPQKQLQAMATGGCNDFKTDEVRDETYAWMREWYPDYFSVTSRGVRWAWKQMLTDALQPPNGHGIVWPLTNIRTYQPWDWQVKVAK